MREDYPPEIEDRHRALRPIAYAASRPGSQYRGKVCIDRGKLILDKKVFTIRPNLNELPPALQPEKHCQRENEKK